MGEKSLSWYVLYTSPRAEKTARKELENRNYNVFLPTTNALKCWKNRQKKIIEQVLFPSYIFIFTNPHELFNIIKIPQIVTFLKTDGKPCTISSKEIETIKRMILFDKTEIKVDTKFYEGEKVRITRGVLVGSEGILVKENGNIRFGIRLNDINHTLLISISKDSIEKI